MGTYGEVLTESMLNGKVSPESPTRSSGKEEFIRTHWLGGRDCRLHRLSSGAMAGTTVKAAVSVRHKRLPDIAADTMYENATEKKANRCFPNTGPGSLA